MNTNRPRVAAIGLNNLQYASIAPLCGVTRESASLDGYLQRYSWTETDVILSSVPLGLEVDSRVSIMTLGPTFIQWKGWYTDGDGAQSRRSAATNVENTERELAVPASCPNLYKPLAAELVRQLGPAAEPPAVVNASLGRQTTLIETTSGYPVALRLVLPTRSIAGGAKPSRSIALLLPGVSNLAAWFNAFLCDLHRSDPIRVPQAPPRLIEPSDWYTPEEKDLADRISQIGSEIKCLSDERDQLQTNLAAEGERADRGVRRALWADGDDLVAAARDLFTNLGFTVRDMDAELREGDPKREDLRLTLQDVSGWQAMVEVKGYPSGTRTNDARQIREHRDRYIQEVGRSPSLTVWLSNPYRTMEPYSRPAPDKNVEDAAEAIGAVHVLTSDLYRQWVLVTTGILDAETVIQSFVNAEPGLWTLPAPGSNT